MRLKLVPTWDASIAGDSLTLCATRLVPESTVRGVYVCMSCLWLVDFVDPSCSCFFCFDLFFFFLLALSVGLTYVMKIFTSVTSVKTLYPNKVTFTTSGFRSAHAFLGPLLTQG